MLWGFLFDLWRAACLCGHGFMSETYRWVQGPGFVHISPRYALLLLQHSLSPRGGKCLPCRMGRLDGGCGLFGEAPCAGPPCAWKACCPQSFSLLLSLFFVACALLCPPPAKCSSFNLTRVVSHGSTEMLVGRVFRRSSARSGTVTHMRFLPCSRLLTPSLSFPDCDLCPLPLYYCGIPFFTACNSSCLCSLQSVLSHYHPPSTCCGLPPKSSGVNNTRFSENTIIFQLSQLTRFLALLILYCSSCESSGPPPGLSCLMGNGLWVLTMAMFFILLESWVLWKRCRWVFFKTSLGMCFRRFWLDFSPWLSSASWNQTSWK